MNRTHLLAFALLAFLALPLAACVSNDEPQSFAASELRSPPAVCPEVVIPNTQSGACSEAACRDGAFIATPHDWLQAPGDYTLTLSTSEETFTCAVSRADDPDRPYTVDCSDPRIDLELPNGDPADQGVIGFSHLPASVHLQVKHGDAIIQEEHLDLTYDATFPNGRACGNACCRADHALPGATPEYPRPR